MTTVSQLIEFLKTQPQDAVIFVNNSEIDLECCWSYRRAVLYQKTEQNPTTFLVLHDTQDEKETCDEFFQQNEILLGTRKLLNLQSEEFVENKTNFKMSQIDNKVRIEAYNKIVENQVADINQNLSQIVVSTYCDNFRSEIKEVYCSLCLRRFNVQVEVKSHPNNPIQRWWRQMKFRKTKPQRIPPKLVATQLYIPLIREVTY